MSEQGHIVYCRFGKDYVSRIAKEQQALINMPGLTAPMKQIATYLINIKKLIRDHNIESESKDFERLSTMRPGRKRYETPPEPFYVPQSPEDQTLVFESRFETGNLLAAIKVTDNEYDLILQNDINTNGHT